jgi:threonine dehydrogenase-like Zn-dependent dehydrogenase
MLAFLLSDGGPRLVRDYPQPEPGAGYVRVRTIAAGICNTDLELARGYMGFRGVLGHEFVGEALEGRLAGRRVVGGINFGCGRCDACERGLARHCSTRRVLGILGADGALAEELVIPERNLHEVPNAVSNTAAVFAEPVAAACEILDQIGSVRGQRVLVVGDGKLGPLVAQVLARDGGDVSLEGHHLETLEWLADAGVHFAHPRGNGAAFDVVVEATGSPAGLARAIEACVPRGTLVLKTTIAGSHQVDLAPIVINELTVVGSRCGRLESALERLADARVNVEPLVSRRFELREVEQAFAAAAERGTRKVLVEVP